MLYISILLLGNCVEGEKGEKNEEIWQKTYPELNSGNNEH